MPRGPRRLHLHDAYRFPGFCPDKTVTGVFGDRYARVVTLHRRKKGAACGSCGRWQRRIYDRKSRCVRDLSSGDRRVFLDLEVRRVECVRCGKVKQEKLSFLANNPFYAKRFAFYVGRRCRSATIKDVAKERISTGTR